MKQNNNSRIFLHVCNTTILFPIYYLFAKYLRLHITINPGAYFYSSSVPKVNTTTFHNSAWSMVSIKCCWFPVLAFLMAAYTNRIYHHNSLSYVVCIYAHRSRKNTSSKNKKTNPWTEI